MAASRSSEYGNDEKRKASDGRATAIFDLPRRAAIHQQPMPCRAYHPATIVPLFRSSSQSPAGQSYLHIITFSSVTCTITRRYRGSQGVLVFHRASPGTPGNNPTRTTACPTTSRLCLLLPRQAVGRYGARCEGWAAVGNNGKLSFTMALVRFFAATQHCTELHLSTTTEYSTTPSHHYTIKRGRAWPLCSMAVVRIVTHPDADAPEKQWQSHTLTRASSVPVPGQAESSTTRWAKSRKHNTSFFSFPAPSPLRAPF